MRLFAAVRARSRVLYGAVLAVVVSTLLVQGAGAAGQSLVISQVYGAGGNSGAVLQNDYIELLNRGTTDVSLDGMSLQYASATGTGLFGATSTMITELSGTLEPGQYLLVHEAGGTNGAALPATDIVDATPIAMAAGAGKVALVSDDDPLGCNGAPPPATTGCNQAQRDRIVDLVGYGGANYFEGSGPAPTISTSLSALRAGAGCVDTDNNTSDFAAGAPNPRNKASARRNCVEDAAPSISSRSPGIGASGVALDSNITITFSEPVTVSGDWFAITCTGSVSHPATVSGDSTTFTLDPTADFAPSASCNVTVMGAQVADADTNDPPDHVVGNPTWNFTTAAPPPPTVEIHEIQGAGHVSPFEGTSRTTTGIVTARRSNGFYMQDPTPDSNANTSDGILVFTGSAPAVSVGDLVRVSGPVVEFRPGGGASANLTTTEFSGATVTVLPPAPGGNAMPAPTLIGLGGRVQPESIIDNDAFSLFDPAQDGIDFYETLEGMRVQVNNPVVVGPRNNNGEIFVLADNGAGAAARTARGGIVIRDLDSPFDYTSGDFNPERIQLDDAAGVATPNVHVGDGLSAAVVGVLDYDFGNFEIEVTTALSRVDNGLARESTVAPEAKELSVATFNVENLDAAEPQSKFDALAAQIVNNMRSPDVVSLEEIQDNNGPTNDSVVDASQTLTKLVNAISALGGPTYESRQIDPVDDQDGGEPGGNIRVGFIFRTDRGLDFVDRPGGGSTTPTTVVAGPDGAPQLSGSPGRIEPANSAWNASRKPLAGEFTFRGETFFLITNHFNSKGGDNPLFGRFQPPVRTTEVQRHQQAQLVNTFVDSILAIDSQANVIVLGDINDFEFSRTMDIVEGGVLTALMKTLPQNERYSYVFEGNSQSLDHIVASNSLTARPFAYDAVHANAEFFDQLSDHDPQVARFLVNSAPTVSAGGPYTVAEGSSIAVSATGNDANGDALTYSWDLDGNGTFETAGQTATFSAAAIDGPATRTVAVRSSDGTASTVSTATVSVTNVAPTARFTAPSSTFAGFPFTLSLDDAADPSTADTAAGFQYAFDCGSGYGAFGSSSSASCPTSTVGTRSVGGKIRDDDGGVTEYRATVDVVVTNSSLCDLVESYASDPNVAEQLCHKLEQAAAAPNENARQGLLGAFRNNVDAKTGKGLTVQQAAILKQLSTEL